MGEHTRLRASDGHEFDAWVARPAGAPRAGLVMIQEIFGLTPQLCRAADRYAAAGYLVVAPALFDRVEPGLVFGYDAVQAGLQTVGRIPEDAVMADVAAARAAAGGATAIIGYCWGGTIAYLGAARLPFDCAVAYYGGGIGALADGLQPQIPVQYHFGGRDAHIPTEVIERIRAADPGGDFHVYPDADHGFCCDDRASYDPDATRLSEARTLDFLARHLQPAG